MLWRLERSQFENQKGEKNRVAMRRIVDSGEIPGILAYANNHPIGWCAVAPRRTYPTLARSRILKPIDDEPVWSIACLFVEKSSRRRGVSVALLKAAIEFVHSRGGRMVEGYPVEPRKDEIPDVFAWTGLASAFCQAGFTECARRSETRPIMRHQIET